jgi:putative copper resistance protein D
MELAPEAAAKAAIYAAVLLALGASATHWLLVPRAARDAGSQAAGAIDGSLARLSGMAAAAMLIAQALRAVAHTAAAFGWNEALVWDELRIIVIDSRWGGGWRIQMAAALLLLGSTFFVRAGAVGWLATTAAAVACAVSMPLLGHAAASPFGIVLHAAHIGGAGLWLGTLASILLVRRAPALDLLRYFSPIALTGASLAVAGGAITAVQYVGAPAHLWDSGYGRTLLLKLGVFLGVVACGYFNWRRWSAVPPATAAVSAGSSRLAAIEVSLAVGIVLITSLLTELAHPST